MPKLKIIYIFFYFHAIFVFYVEFDTSSKTIGPNGQIHYVNHNLY